MLEKKKPIRDKNLVKCYHHTEPYCELTSQMNCEVHHILYKSQQGGDERQNLISVSPSLHAQIHKMGPPAREILQRYKRNEIDRFECRTELFDLMGKQ